MPSVSRAAGTVCSTRETVATRVGAIAQPATSSASPITGTEPMNISGAIASPSANAPHRTRRVGPLRQAIAPVTIPESMLPSAHSASRPPAYALAPCSPANATVVTSAEPKSAPRAAETTLSGATVAQGSRGRAPAARWCRCAGGSVERWAVNARVPATPQAMATLSPASGCQVVASTVTMIGPTMNTASSATASRA